MKKIIAVASLIIVVAIIFSSVGSCSVCSNETHRSWFDEQGNVVPDTTLTKTDSFTIVGPSKVHFFMEASGSMNGFLRGGVPTHFKSDLWQIINYYSNIVPAVSVLSTDNGKTTSIDLGVAQFQNPLNGGGFVCGQSTNLCQMLKSVVNSIHPENGEVAVFVSDMEYDPVGAVAPLVLASVFATDVASILSEFGYSASLVAATSNCFDRTGNLQTNARPYYYLILGKAECIAEVRNCVSAMLDDQDHFIDNIETGFDYGMVNYAISDFSGCTQVGNSPSLCSISDAGCSIELSVKLENYRWLLTTDEDVLAESFKISSKNGSKVTVDSISYQIENVVNKQLKRDVIAKFHLTVSQMPYDCDILTWNLDVPATNTSKLQSLFTDTPNSVEQTFSIREFITGMFRASLVCRNGKDNYIHISKD